jgi:hypothetical protein
MTKKKADKADESVAPSVAEAPSPVQAGSPVVDRTSVTVEEGRAFVRVDRPDEALSPDELHNLRRQCETAFIEVS